MRAEDAPLTFEKDIFPIFDKKCSGCHSPEAEELKGSLDLSTFEKMTVGGKKGKVFVPGKADDSRLVQMIEWKLDPYMPPPRQFERLKGKEIDLIKLWINQGAKSEKAVAGVPAQQAPAAAPAKVEKPTAPAEKIEKKVEEVAKPAPVPQAAPAAAPKPEPGKTEPAKAEPVVAKPATPAQSAPAPVAAAAGAASSIPAPISSIAFSPDGKLLARGGLHIVELVSIDPASGAMKSEGKLEGHAEMVRALAFSPDGRFLAAAGGSPGRSGEAKIWKVADRSLAKTITGHKDNILGIAYRPDGKRIATSSYDKLIKIWDVETGAEVRTLKNHVDAVFSVAYSPDGKRIASGSGDRTVKLWDAETGDMILTLSDCLDSVYSLAFDPTGTKLAAGAADKMIRVWDISQVGGTFSQSQVNTGKLIGSSFAHSGAVLRVLYSPDGSEIFSTSEDKRIKVWDAAKLTEKRAFEAQSDWVSALAVSPDGHRLAAGRYDSSSALYETATGKLIAGANPQPVAVADAAKKPKEEKKEMAAATDDEKKANALDVGAIIIKATIPPSLSGISPSLASRGTEFEMTVDGKNLEGAEVTFSHPSIFAELVSSEALPIPEVKRDNKSTGAQIIDNAKPYRLKLKVTVPVDVPLGGHALILRSPLGLAESGFRVMPWPDSGEVEPNDTAEQAQEIKFPATIAGAMNKAGDIDRYKVQMTQNQDLVFALTDSSLDPSMRLLDAAGKMLATSDEFGGMREARLGYHAAAAGEVYLEISDRDLRAGLGYRLHVGEFPFVTDVYPLGVVAGAPQKVAVKGFNLGGVAEMTVNSPAEADYGATVALPIPVVEGNPIPARRIAVASAPELMEAEPNNQVSEAQAVPFPSIIDGKIKGAKTGGDDVDLYRFSAKKGEVIVIETMAERLGSALDSVIDILDAKGNPLQRAQARCVAQTIMTLSGRDSRGAGIRLESWTDLRMNDYVMLGSEILRVSRLPGYADEDVSFASFPNGQRKSFFGTTPEHHAVNAPVYKIEIHPPDAQFAPNGMPVFPIYWRNDDGYFEGAGTGDSLVEFHAPSDGEFIVRVRDTMGTGGDDHAYRLLLRKLSPNFEIAPSPYRLDVAAGERSAVNVRVRRRDGFNEPVAVEIKDLPKGFTATSGVVLPDDESLELTVSAEAGADSTALDAFYKVIAKSTLGGKEAVREARLGSITVAKAQPDLVVKNGEQQVAIKPGESSTVTVNLDRFNGFNNRVPIDVLNLPYGVRVLDTGLNGILVRPNETTRSMQIFAEPWVKPMKRTIHVRAKIESASRSPVFVGPPLELVIGDPDTKPTAIKATIASDKDKAEAFLSALR